MASVCVPTSLAMLMASNVSRSFGSTLANDMVSLTVGSGEIVGLVGENGAGKSTLLSILAGFLRPDTGTISINGGITNLSSPGVALSVGIGLVHQHLSLIPSFTVSEQLELAGWTSASLPDVLAADFHGDEIIEHLAMGRRQRVEIAKVLVARPKVLLLDEPTSILAPSEVDALFEVLRSLRGAGIGILIVTHKLQEVMTLADRIVVMAGGKVTGSFDRTGDAWDPGTGNEVLKRMFDWTAPDSATITCAAMATEPKDDPALDDFRPVLRLLDVNVASPGGGPEIGDINFDVLPGQIHAIVGIDGQGQADLAGVIAGYQRSGGRIELAGHDISNVPSIERARLGLALLVDDRLGEAAIGSLSIAENLVLKRPRPESLARGGLFRRDRVLKHAQSVIARWGIEPSDPQSRFGSLSGGNMQRVLAARELDRDPQVLIALNPVQGLDVRTSSLLWTQLRRIADRGSGVLIFTTDLDEALSQADRCGVIHDGRVSPLLPVNRAAKRAYGSMMVDGW